MTTNLPRWATISQVSAALKMKREVVYQMVRTALAYGHLWVKWGTPPHLFGRACLLIDTESAAFLDVAREWKEKGQAAVFPLSATKERSSSTASSEAGAQVPIAPHHQADLRESKAWLEEWLADQGAIVFTNALQTSTSAPWHWQWAGERQGGYTTREEAIQGALSHRLEVMSSLSFSLLGSDSAITSPSHTLNEAPSSRRGSSPSLVRSTWHLCQVPV